MNTDEMAQIITDAWRRLDFERLRPLFADNAEYVAGGPARGSRRVGRDAVMAGLHRAINEVFLIERVEVSKVLVTKDHVVLVIHDEGKSRITGRPYANDLLFMYEIKDGKIVLQREYLDTISAARATGDLPYPD
jgi:ketosteroid isomerase-like protein